MSRRRERASSIPVLQDGSSMGERLFKEAGESGFEYIVFEALGDRFEKLGYAVCKVAHVYPGDSQGRYLDLKYLGTNNPYYKWFIENEGKPGGLDKDAYHHLCRRHASRCSVNLGRSDVVHVQKWAPISRATASDILEEWGQPRLGPERPPPQRAAVAVVGAGVDSKAKPASTPRRSQAVALAALPAPDDVEILEDEEEEEEVPASAPSRKPSLKRKRRPANKETRDSTALDAMLDDGLAEVDSSADKHIDRKLGQLRAKLQGRKEEAKAKASGSVLANKAMEAAGSVKPKKSKQGIDVLKTLGKALSSKSRSSKGDVSSDETEDEEETGPLDLDSAGGWEARRKRLRQVAAEKPGKLLLAGLQSMHEQLGQTTGESSEDVMCPVMVRYLLSIVLPSHPVKDIGQSKYRELRTIAQALD